METIQIQVTKLYQILSKRGMTQKDLYNLISETNNGENVSMYILNEIVTGKRKNYNIKTKQRENNIYTLLAKSNWKPKPCTNSEHGSHAQKNEKPCTNNDESHAQQLSSNKTHINNTQLTTHAKQALQGSPKNISEVIKQFESVNKACADFYNNTTQRKAVDKLISAYGYEMVINVVKILPKMNKVLYNKATTPVELWNKWAKIEAEASKLKETKSSSKYAINRVY